MTLGYRVKVKGMEELVRKIRSGDKAVRREATNAMDASVKIIEANTKPLVPVGVSGRLRNSITSRVTTTGTSIIGSVGSELRGEQYPSVIEAGRRPGSKMPPPSALVRWVELKLGVSAEEAPGVAFLVARSIARKGIRGRRFLKQGVQQSMAFINSRWAEALRRITEGIANGR